MGENVLDIATKKGIDIVTKEIKQKMCADLWKRDELENIVTARLSLLESGEYRPRLPNDLAKIITDMITEDRKAVIRSRISRQYWPIPPAIDMYGDISLED